MIGKFIFFLYLVCISLQDIKTMKVTRIFHVMGIAGVIIMLIQEGYSDVSYTPIVFFLLIQLGCYCFGCYGLADLFLFINCSLYMGVSYTKEDTLLYLFLFQLLANILLIVVQLCVGNFRKGRLRKKVAYIPYLSTAFILTNIVL